MQSSSSVQRARGLSSLVVAVRRSSEPESESERSLDELESLLRGLSIAPAGRVVQRREGALPPTYLGEGKLREVADLTGGCGVASVFGATPSRVQPARDDLVVVVDDVLSPAQHRALVTALGVEVLDRTEVILRVFEQRARTPIACMEVELARLQHALPRVRDDHALGDREGGGGRASRGHTNVELAKQRIRDRVAALRRALAAGKATGRRGTEARVALVGYTNAGKSSLMQALTGSEVFVKDMLFATLDTTARPMVPATVPPVWVVDTVGFLHRLPHALMASFRATLAEALVASLVLVVVDASDAAWADQLAVTRSVLAEIGAADDTQWVVFNKADRLAEETRARMAAAHPTALFVSALRQDDAARLRVAIVSHFAQGLSEAKVAIPLSGIGVFASFRDRLEVLEEEWGDALVVTVRGDPVVLAQLRARMAAR